MAFSLAWISATPAFTTLQADIWAPFEFTAAAGAATTTQLENDDHYATTGVTNISDGSSLLSTSTSGERALTGRPQSIQDTGTTGLAVSLAANVNTYWQWTVPGSSQFFCGFWLNGATITSGNEYYVFKLADNGSNFCCFFGYRNSAGQHQVRLSPGNEDSFFVNVTPGTWYWVEAVYTKGGPCKGRVVDVNGNIVGSEASTTDTLNRTPNFLRIGTVGVLGFTDSGKTIFMDDMIISWTTPTYPEGP